MGSYRIHLDANRSAVRAMGAAHECPELGRFALGTPSRRADEQKLPATLELPLS